MFFLGYEKMVWEKLSTYACVFQLYNLTQAQLQKVDSICSESVVFAE